MTDFVFGDVRLPETEMVPTYSGRVKVYDPRNPKQAWIQGDPTELEQ